MRFRQLGIRYGKKAALQCAFASRVPETSDCAGVRAWSGRGLRSALARYDVMRRNKGSQQKNNGQNFHSSPDGTPMKSSLTAQSAHDGQRLLHIRHLADAVDFRENNFSFLIDHEYRSFRMAPRWLMISQYSIL